MALLTLPDLPYAFDALEPTIDAETMQIHHDRHHKAYVDGYNKNAEGTEAANLPLEEVLKNISKYPKALRNNGGGHYNHSLFWTILGPNSKKAPEGKLAEAINTTFGSLDAFKEAIEKAGAGQFGSGWAWLVVTPEKKLVVSSTPNQDNPLMDVAEVKGTPIFGVDVWEHAYYLKYQNKRPAYLEAIWNVINWDEVAKRYAAAL